MFNCPIALPVSFTLQDGQLAISEESQTIICLNYSGALERNAIIFINPDLFDASANGKCVTNDSLFNHLTSWPTDFELSQTFFTLSEQVNMACVNLTALTDSRVENNEEFILALTSTDPAVEILTNSLLVSIVDQSTGKLKLYEAPARNSVMDIFILRYSCI